MAADTKTASKEPTEATAPATDETPEPADDLESRLRHRRIVTGGHATNCYKLINPPPDKKIKMISERDRRRGLYHDWDLYTPAHWKADRAKYGTDFAIQPTVDGNRLMVKLHFPVFIPMDIWVEIQRLKNRRRNALQSPMHQMKDLQYGEIPKKRSRVFQGPRGMVEDADQWNADAGGR